ncbi:MAG TPA: hypothetical protein DCM14_06915 [Clostridiales bacterium UBA8153]|nr:hypothetical protein [Clostridiales bacterium UBA8153]
MCQDSEHRGAVSLQSVEQVLGRRLHASAAPAGGTGNSRERVLRPAAGEHLSVPFCQARQLLRFQPVGVEPCLFHRLFALEQEVDQLLGTKYYI